LVVVEVVVKQVILQAVVLVVVVTILVVLLVQQVKVLLVAIVVVMALVAVAHWNSVTGDLFAQAREGLEGLARALPAEQRAEAVDRIAGLLRLLRPD
jgi:hypothetical protein